MPPSPRRCLYKHRKPGEPPDLRSVREEDLQLDTVRRTDHVDVEDRIDDMHRTIRHRDLNPHIRRVNRSNRCHRRQHHHDRANKHPLVVCRGISDLVEGGSSSFDFGDDLFGGLVPDEWSRVVVPVFGPQFDGIDELLNTGETVAA
jgi:hypothetical protein